MSLNFDLVDLRLFRAVSDEQNLTKGARRVFLSASAASTRIRRLEGQIGAKLLYRSMQGVELTAMGATFLKHIRLVLRQIDHLEEECGVMGDSGSGHLRIFANTTAVTEFLPDALSKFMAQRPRLTVAMLERETADILNGVVEGAADIGIVAGPVQREGLQIFPFSTDHVVLVAPVDHPLASKSQVRFTEVFDYQHIGLHEGSSLLSFLRELGKQHGKQLKVRIQVKSFESLCRMAAANVGIALIPESAALRHQQQMKLAIVPVNEPWALRERSIVVRDLEGLSSAGRALVQDLFLLGHPRGQAPCRG